MEMVLTGEPMKANEALSRGLVSRVVDPKECEKAALDIGLKIAKMSNLASK